MLSCLVQADSEIHSFKIPTHTFSSIFKAILHKLDLPATCKQLKWLWRNLTSDKFHASGVLLVDQFADPRKRRPCGDVFGRARCAATVKHISNCLEELRAKSNLKKKMFQEPEVPEKPNHLYVDLVAFSSNPVHQDGSIVPLEMFTVISALHQIKSTYF